MTITIIRPGQKVYHVPRYGISVTEGGVMGGVKWWEVSGKPCVVAYQPKGAVSYTASKTNLANPGTYDAQEGVAPTWEASSGWTFDGSDDHLKCGYVKTEQSQSVIVAFTNMNPPAGEYRYLLGHSWGAGKQIYIRGYASERTAANGGVCNSLGEAVLSGVYAMAGNRAYLNGSAVGNEMTDWTGTHSLTFMAIGALNNYSLVQYMLNVTISALAVYSDSLTAAQVATVSAAMADL